MWERGEARLSFETLRPAGRNRRVKMAAMTDAELLNRIVQDPSVLAGKPIIAGTRLSVEYVLNLLAHGESIDAIIAEYEGIAPEDVRACLLFAQRSLGSMEFLPLAAPA